MRRPPVGELMNATGTFFSVLLAHSIYRNDRLSANKLLGCLVVLSSAAFASWSALLKYNRVSIVTAFNFLVPVFGALLSAAFLRESVLMEWKNTLALLLVSYGIWRVTREEPTPR